MAIPWHTQSAEHVLRHWSSSEAGLAAAEAAARLKTHGPNELTERRGKGPLAMLWEQFTETMVLILIAAGVISAFLGKGTETAAILAIVVLFAVLGFVQEYRAEQAMAALKQLAVPIVRVRRGGTLQEMSARELVPGDIVLLEAGNVVPADVRLLESANLRIQEAALTGESEAVEKTVAAIPAKPTLPLGDRRNMAYLGTVGHLRPRQRPSSSPPACRPSSARSPASSRTWPRKRPRCSGASTGSASPRGRGRHRGGPGAAGRLVARRAPGRHVPHGGQRGRGGGARGAAGGRHHHPRPRAPSACCGATPSSASCRPWRPSGSVTVICSDKTGTLTENRMTVTVVDAAGERLEPHGEPAPPRPDRDGGGMPHLRRLGPAAAHPPGAGGGALCNDAVLKPDPGPGCFHAIGDPTEGALLVAAARSGHVPGPPAGSSAARRRSAVRFEPQADDHGPSPGRRRRAARCAARLQGRPDMWPSPKAPWTACWSLARTSGLQSGRSRSPMHCGSRSARRTTAWPRPACGCWEWPSGRWRQRRPLPTPATSSATSRFSAWSG